MRIPVFARRANPSVDPPILRKSRSYAEEQIQNGLADWVDFNDPRKGIIAREYLPSGKALAAMPEQLEELSALSPPPDAGLKFIRPPMEQNPTLPRINVQSVRMSAPTWDWSQETATA